MITGDPAVRGQKHKTKCSGLSSDAWVSGALITATDPSGHRTDPGDHSCRNPHSGGLELAVTTLLLCFWTHRRGNGGYRRYRLR